MLANAGQERMAMLSCNSIKHLFHLQDESQLSKDKDMLGHVYNNQYNSLKKEAEYVFEVLNNEGSLNAMCWRQQLFVLLAQCESESLRLIEAWIPQP